MTKQKNKGKQMTKISLITTLLLTSTLSMAFDLGGFVKESAKHLTTSQKGSSSSSLSDSIVGDGLKEALKVGVEYGVKELSKEDGYLSNEKVKIPLPENLQKVEKLIRKAGGDQIAQNLIVSMNKAASKAAPKTAVIFVDAIKNMSIDDAKKILAGKDDAATKYFEKHTNKSLKETIKPIIQETMKENKVASYYKTFNEFYKSNAAGLVEKSGAMKYAKQFGVDSYIPKSDENIDDYVTTQAIQGLYKMISEKESEIRKEPLAQTTSLLKKVFGN